MKMVNNNLGRKTNIMLCKNEIQKNKVVYWKKNNFSFKYFNIFLALHAENIFVMIEICCTQVHHNRVC